MIVGIDLGTTNSLVAYFRNGQAQIIPNRLGSNLTPSVVAITKDNQVLVGSSAVEYGYLHPDSAASVFKRTMGTEKRYILSGQMYTSTELSSFVLKALVEDASAYLKEKINSVVISVPAYFDENHRKATKQAGELAGLVVERIISEPTAASLAYGIHLKGANQQVLVFDLGGGTFDVSVLEMVDNIFEVRAVAGDNYLGGEDFTRIIMQEFADEHGINLDEISEKERLRLRKAAETTKIALSASESAIMTYGDGTKQMEKNFNASEYKKSCQILLNKIRDTILRALKDSNLTASDIREIIFVGGATRMPFIREEIVHLFRLFPNIGVNPDEAVALGAAIVAAMKERDEAVKEMILIDVCPFTLGTNICVKRSVGYEDGQYLPIIERNTVIPTSNTKRLCTVYDNQNHIDIEILQGESRLCKNNLQLGKLSVMVPSGPAGKECIDVTYTYDVNSLLEIVVKVVSTGDEKRLIIKGNDVDMTPEEIDKRMAELAYLKIPPAEQEENRYLLLKGERLFEETTGELRQFVQLAILRFEDALQNKRDIEAARKLFAEQLRKIEDELLD